ncbi:MAG TPA: PDZ domain-containing protein [Gemmatimonadales bacterium]
MLHTTAVRRLAAVAAILPLAACGAVGAGGVRGASPARVASAPVSDVRYEVTFDSATAARRTLHVAMTFGVSGDAPVALSLPAWTPGAYEISNFARWVTDFGATGDGRDLAWDRVDHDTWRVMPAGARSVTVSFDYRADTLDNAMAWSRTDFAFFNGTNVFLYPEGRPMEFASTVTVRTQPGWRVATGMTPAGAPNTYREGNYNDLVDMPFFIGRFDLDSTTIAGRVTRLASYPEGAIAGEQRRSLWRDMAAMIPPQIAVFGDTAYSTYTTMIVVSEETGGSALEHQSSHLGIYHPALLSTVNLPSITAHEIFHLWNVKRLRPAALWPYDYSRAQPTTLLWASEGITDYYADVALVRGGVIDSAGFLALTQGKIERVGSAPPVSLEDASLATWIRPIENPYIYYDKGSLLGFMLDILIRDASDGQGSLDTVMRELYDTAYRQGRGFTNEMFWAAASRAAGGRDFSVEYRRYVDGRERYPWDSVLPLAGLRLMVDTLHVPMLGVFTQGDSTGTTITSVAMTGVAERAGVQPGDRLISVGDVRVRPGEDFGAVFRSRYAGRAGEPLPIVVRRGDRTLTLTGRVEMSRTVQSRLIPDPRASARAARIRAGIFHGR